jgi:hypothetical protein
MQNNYLYAAVIKQQNELEKRKKEELLDSTLFKILEKENKIECDKLKKYLEDKTSEEIENIIKYIIIKKSVQKS